MKNNLWDVVMGGLVCCETALEKKNSISICVHYAQTHKHTETGVSIFVRTRTLTLTISAKYLTLYPINLYSGFNPQKVVGPLKDISILDEFGPCNLIKTRTHTLMNSCYYTQALFPMKSCDQYQRSTSCAHTFCDVCVVYVPAVAPACVCVCVCCAYSPSCLIELPVVWPAVADGAGAVNSVDRCLFGGFLYLIPPRRVVHCVLVNTLATCVCPCVCARVHTFAPLSL